MEVAYRTERLFIPKNISLKQLCHKTKNLYNRANYLIKSHFLDTNYLITYIDLYWIVKKETVYTDLPAQTAQQTLKQLVRNWDSYIKSIKEWRKHPNKFLSQPRYPRYKKKRGESIAFFTNQQTKLVNGVLKFPQSVTFSKKTRLPDNTRIKEVRIIPQGIGYSLEIVYQKRIRKIRKKFKQNRKGAIDFGMTNLVTFVDNIGSRPIVIKDTGNGIKSITQYYLKETAKIQSKYNMYLTNTNQRSMDKFEFRTWKTLHQKWKNRVNNWLHQVSRFIINISLQRELNTIVIGYNSAWKQHLRLRRKTTQMFVYLPFKKLIKLIEYKGEECGINVELVDEAYTSKCSFLDNEEIKKHKFYAGKRMKRGLFQSSNGQLINADVNAAFNILIKSDPQAFPQRSVGGVGGYVIYPYQVSFT